MSHKLAADRVGRVVATPPTLNDLAMRIPRGDLYAQLLAPRIARRLTQNTFRYRIFGKDRYRETKNDWAPGTIPNEIRSKWSDTALVIPERKLRHPLLDSEVTNADEGFDLQDEYTGTVTNATLITREARVARLFTTAANYPAGHVLAKGAGAEWTAVGVINTIAPITDLNAQIALVSKAARVPRSAISVAMPQDVYDAAIRENTGILDAFKYTSGGAVEVDNLRARLGVREVILVQSRVATGPEVVGEDIVGLAETDLWGETVWVGVRTDERAAETNISFARTAVWDAALRGPGGRDQDVLIRQYRMGDEGQEGDYIEAKEAQLEYIAASFAGALITNTRA